MTRARIVIADDHLETRESVARTLQPEFDTVGTAVDGKRAVAMVLETRPDVVILDVAMPHMSGIEAARGLRRAGSTVKIVILTVHDEPEYIEAALACGVLGYVIKNRAGIDLIPAVRAALLGQTFISPTSRSRT